MTEANNSILPFYDKKSRQHHLNISPYGLAFLLIAENKKLIDFQFKRETSINDIHTVLLRNLSTGGEVNIYTEMVAAGLEVQAFSPAGEDSYDLIVFPGITDMDINTPDGTYEIDISWGFDDEAVTVYSDRFQIRNDVSDLIKISYWHDKPFLVPGAHISYRSPFKSFLYLDSVINKPEYEEEAIQERRDGYLFNRYSVSFKTFRILGLVIPEYLCDALRLVWMHHYVQVEFKGDTYDVDDIRVIYDKWLDQGNLKPIQIEFHTDTVVTEVGYIKDQNDGGDYDQTDYNDDHLIS